MSEPITLAEAKAYLRETSSDHDDLITALITDAREEIEADTWRALVPLTKTVQLRGFPVAEPGAFGLVNPAPLQIVLPRPPLISIESLTYIDAAGVERSYDVETLRIDIRHEPGTIEPPYGSTWPETRDDPAAVVIEFVCGYPTTDDVPQMLKAAVRLILSQLYEHAEPTELARAGGGTGQTRTTLDRILEKFRIRDKRLLAFL